MLRRTEPAGPTTSLDRALARAGDGAFVTGIDGRIALWNRSAERILGYTAPDVPGTRFCYQGCHVMSLVRMDEAVQSFDMRTRTKAGRPVCLAHERRGRRT